MINHRIAVQRRVNLSISEFIRLLMRPCAVDALERFAA